MDGFNYAEVFSVMSCIDAVPVECCKRLKHPRKIDLPDTRQEESQLWIIGKLKQKNVYIELISKITTTPTEQ